MPGMITHTLYPDLAPEAEKRLTGILMAREIGGALKAVSDPVRHQMIRWFARLVDGVLVDYQAARAAYFRYYEDETVGGQLPISAALVPMFHHIENCVSNMERVREMAEAIRTRHMGPGATPLVEKNDWRVAENYEPHIKGLRNAIQHTHDDLKSGEVFLGTNKLALTDLARALRVYHRIGTKMIKELTIPTTT
jgi:hypothetical protein